jgi:MYXO-CTERM domain-containing protein
MPPRRSTALGVYLYVLLVGQAVHAADPVVIVEPKDGDVVPTNFSIKVIYGEVEYCDTGGCILINADTVEVYAEGASGEPIILEQCRPCPDGEANLDVVLAPGQYEIWAAAGLNVAIKSSEVTEITVEEGTTGTESTDADSTGGPAEKDGCACTSAQAPGASIWLAFLALAAFRRRHHCPSQGLPATPPKERMG